MSFIAKGIQAIFPDESKKTIKSLTPLVDKVFSYEEELKILSGIELKERGLTLKARVISELEELTGDELEQKEKKLKSRLIGSIFTRLGEGALAKALGGGEAARAMAELITNIKYDLPADDPPRPAKAKPAANGAPGPDGNHASHGGPETADDPPAAATTFPPPLQPNQTKSN